MARHYTNNWKYDDSHPSYLRNCPCGEYWMPALKNKLLANGNPICRNCASTRPTGKCPICNKTAALEHHHVYGRTKPKTIPVCLNCHAVLTSWQVQDNHRSNLPRWFGMLEIIGLFMLRNPPILAEISHLFTQPIKT
jgi:hypothetical protein